MLKFVKLIRTDVNKDIKFVRNYIYEAFKLRYQTIDIYSIYMYTNLSFDLQVRN